MTKYTTSICRSITLVYYFEVEAGNKEEANDLAYERMCADDGCDPIDWETEAKKVHEEDWVQQVEEIK